MPDELENIPPPETASLDPDLLRRAAAFMSEVRQVQRESGRTLSGKSWLSEGTYAELHKTRNESGLLLHWPNLPKALFRARSRRLLSIALKRCAVAGRSRSRRNCVHRYTSFLALELVVNNSTLDIAPQRIVSVTVYNGSLEGMDDPFPDFRDTPGIFRQAADHNPRDPEGFLTDDASPRRSPASAPTTDSLTSGIQRGSSFRRQWVTPLTQRASWSACVRP